MRDCTKHKSSTTLAAALWKKRRANTRLFIAQLTSVAFRHCAVDAVVVVVRPPEFETAKTKRKFILHIYTTISVHVYLSLHICATLTAYLADTYCESRCCAAHSLLAVFLSNFLKFNSNIYSFVVAQILI